MAGIVRANPQGLKEVVKDMGVLLEGFAEEVMSAISYDAFVDAYITAMDTEAYLGITIGGIASTMENETRITEYDGRRVRSVGDFTVDSANPQIVTKLKRHDVPNLRRVFPMSDVTVDPVSKRTIIEPRLGTPQPGDYMTDLCWVREMGDGGFKVVILLNAINFGSPAESGADKSESELDVTFIGNALTFDDTEHAPMKIIIFPPTVATP